MLKSKQNVSYLRGIPVATNAYLTLKQLCDVTVENNQSETVSDDWQLMRNVDSRIRFSLAVESAKNLNELGQFYVCNYKSDVLLLKRAKPVKTLR